MKVLFPFAGAAITALAACGFASAASCQAPPQVRSGYVAHNGARLYYEEAGTGPAVVLSHGGFEDRRMWDREFSWLARNYRVIRYDIRGHGRSQADGVPFADWEDLHALLDSLHVGRVAIVGLSMGGGIAADFALTYPDRVSALVLVGPGLSGVQPHGGEFDSLMSEMRAASAIGVSALNDAFVRWWCVGPHRQRSEVAPAVLAAVEEMVAGSGSRWALAGLTRQLNPPAFGRLREIRAPTLVVVGDLDASIIFEIADSAAAQVPGARKVVIAGAAHQVNMEKPAEFEAAVRPFLAERVR